MTTLVGQALSPANCSHQLGQALPPANPQGTFSATFPNCSQHVGQALPPANPQGTFSATFPNCSHQLGQALPPANPPESFPATFPTCSHYMWGRRFRLPTLYVLPPQASPLASRSQRSSLPFHYLALSRFAPAEPTAPAPPTCAPLSRPSLPRRGPRNGQSRFRTSLAARYTCSRHGDPDHSPWRERQKLLSAPSLGDHAQPCAYPVASQDPSAGDYALAEGIHGTACEPDPRPHRGGILAR
jgi:hypothetical protein